MRRWIQRLSRAQVALLWLAGVLLIGAFAFGRTLRLQALEERRQEGAARLSELERDTVIAAAALRRLEEESRPFDLYQLQTGRSMRTPKMDSLQTMFQRFAFETLELKRKHYYNMQLVILDDGFEIDNAWRISLSTVLAVGSVMFLALFAVTWIRFGLAEDLTPAQERDSPRPKAPTTPPSD